MMVQWLGSTAERQGGNMSARQGQPLKSLYPGEAGVGKAEAVANGSGGSGAEWG